MENNTINCNHYIFCNIKTFIVETETENYEFSNIFEPTVSIEDRVHTTVDVTIKGMSSHLFYLVASAPVIKRLRFRGTVSNGKDTNECDLVFEGPFVANSGTLNLNLYNQDCRIIFTRFIVGEDKKCAFYDVTISNDIQENSISKPKNSLSIYKAHLDAQKQRRIPA